MLVVPEWVVAVFTIGYILTIVLKVINIYTSEEQRDKE